MDIQLILLVLLIIVFLKSGLAEPSMYPARLVQRFSDEAKAHAGVRVLNNGAQVAGLWPRRRSLEYYRLLLSSDVKRQTLKLGPKYQFLYSSEGSSTIPLGNDFGWLHYMWIDIGTPKVSFLVALDTGSDLFWVPCDCVQCAPLSASNYSTLDKDFNEYDPSSSSSSKPVSCSHQLCVSGPNCLNPKQHCPYTVNYYSDDTSTSGFLVEDFLHLIPGHSDVSNKSVKAPVIVGCGSKQTGGYLSGVAPNGLLGLGLAEISVPSLLAKAGYIKNSFSLCFNEDDTGRLFFGNQGVAGQQTTPFLSLDGKNLTYIVGVDACCIGDACVSHIDLRMLVDSGTSFTFLPVKVYEKVVDEFDRQVNATKFSFEGYPWQYCYNSNSREVSKIVPSLTLKFATAKGFVITSPVFVIYGAQDVLGFCLAVQPTDENIGTIGQNFMTGYQLVFDRENFRLGWSRSNCQDLNNLVAINNTSGNSNSPNSLPTTEQQSSPQVVTPAVAGRTPSTSSITCPSCFVEFLLSLHVAHYLINLINQIVFCS